MDQVRIVLSLLALVLCHPALSLGGPVLGSDGSNAAAVQALGDIGSGVNIGLIGAGNALTTHEDFQDSNGVSHAFYHNATNDGVDFYLGAVPSHDTWVTGIMIGRGSADHPDDIGVAPGANAYSVRVVTTPTSAQPNSIQQSFVEAAFDYLVSQNVRVVCTGIDLSGTGSPAPNGSSSWTEVYDYYAYTNNLILAIPAGNYDTTDNVFVFGDAYNGITTGGLSNTDSNTWGQVGSVSCLGLTADGRRKPDLCAPSENQEMPSSASNTEWTDSNSAGGQYGATSFSAPHTAGVAALLLALADKSPGSNANQNQVIHAVIVNSTFPNIIDNNGLATTGAIYNVSRGYGRINALDAYNTLAAPKITTSGTVTAPCGWAYSSITASAHSAVTQTYTISTSFRYRLLTTLAWNRKVTRSGVPGAYSYSTSFVNFNLQVLDPVSASLFNDTGTKDNLKKCDLLLNTTGNYLVKVTLNNTTTKSITASYGLAFETIAPIPGDFDLNYIVDANDLLTFANNWLLTGTGLLPDIAAPFGQVDFADFAAFAQNWLVRNKAYNGLP
jgi:hypothetical protein